MTDFLLLLLGWVAGYAFCLVWRLGRPAKSSLLSLAIGWMIGRHQDHHD